MARRLGERELPSGVSVMDVGTSGLDLAYEVMRGYSALVIVDVSRQGGEPGTLYVIDVEPDDVPAEIEDGETIDPHSMDPMTMLRFVRAIGGWPGRVQVIACEPAMVEDVGLGLTPPVEAAVERAIELVLETIARAARPTRRTRAGLMHELSISSAIVDTVVRHARGPARDRGARAARAAAPGRARRRWPSTSSSSRARPCARARGWTRRSSRRRCAARAARTRGRSTCPPSAARAAGRRT